jgi:hypothetical protein
MSGAQTLTWFRPRAPMMGAPYTGQALRVLTGYQSPSPTLPAAR